LYENFREEWPVWVISGFYQAVTRFGVSELNIDLKKSWKSMGKGDRRYRI